MKQRKRSLQEWAILIIKIAFWALLVSWVLICIIVGLRYKEDFRFDDRSCRSFNQGWVLVEDGITPVEIPGNELPDTATVRIRNVIPQKVDDRTSIMIKGLHQDIRVWINGELVGTEHFTGVRVELVHSRATVQVATEVVLAVRVYAECAHGLGAEICLGVFLNKGEVGCRKSTVAATCGDADCTCHDHHDSDHDGKDALFHEYTSENNFVVRTFSASTRSFCTRSIVAQNVKTCKRILQKSDVDFNFSNKTWGYEQGKGEKRDTNVAIAR